MCGEVSTDFKSSNRIEISRLVQVLLNFTDSGGPPCGVGGWVEGGGGWWEGAPYPCAHACRCMYVHAHAHAYDIIGNSQVFPQWGWPFAWYYHVYHACMCMRARACVHVCACRCMCMYVGGTPQPPPTYPSTHPPTPRATGSPKHQNSISLELIEIIRFCLKILYLWTFLNSYRL